MVNNFTVPIESSNLKSVIPEGDIIHYSTMCDGNIIYGNRTISWKSHILITENGIAHMYPILGGKDTPITPDYTEWAMVDLIFKRLGNPVFYIKGFEYTLKRLKDVESKEEFDERKSNFMSLYKNTVYQKKTKWLAENENSTDKKIKKLVKGIKKQISKI